MTKKHLDKKNNTFPIKFEKPLKSNIALKMFNKSRNYIKVILDSNHIDINSYIIVWFGSTSIGGIHGKNIIDIMIKTSIKNLMPIVNTFLKKAGKNEFNKVNNNVSLCYNRYINENAKWPEKLYYFFEIKINNKDPFYVNLHITANTFEYIKVKLFKNALIKNKNLIKKYTKIKRTAFKQIIYIETNQINTPKLSNTQKNDIRIAYTNAKKSFITNVLKSILIKKDKGSLINLSNKIDKFFSENKYLEKYYKTDKIYSLFKKFIEK